VEDSATAFIRLEDGGTLTLEVTWGLLMEKDFAYLNLFGSGGAALLNPLRLHKGMHGSLVNVTPAIESSRNQYKQAIEAEIAHFCDALRKGQSPQGSGDELLPVMEMIDAIYRSAAQGKEVRLA
jgi:predicted dehydrogenase